MIKKIVYLSLVALISMGAAAPIEGYWKTIDDVTGKPKAIIQISESATHALQGKVIKVFPQPDHEAHELCTACEGERHNQRIVGMTILSGLQADPGRPGTWQNGEILDPHNGKVYKSMAQLTDNNQKLSVRGYIGLPLFGRSQVWEKASEEDAKTELN